MRVTTMQRITVTLEKGVTVDLADITANRLIAMGVVKATKGNKNKNSGEENPGEKNPGEKKEEE